MAQREIQKHIELLKSKNFAGRKYAAIALETRTNAAIALANIGPDAKEAVPALIEILRDKSSEVHAEAAAALGEISDPAAVPHLTEALKDKDVRKAAAKALKKLKGKR